MMMENPDLSSNKLQPVNPMSSKMLLGLLSVVIVLLPVQFEVKSDLRIAPGDLVLAATVLLGIFFWRLIPSTWSMWHVGLLSMFFLHLVFKVMRTSAFTQGDLVQKMGGLVVLNCLFVCISSLSFSWGNIRWLLKVFVVSVTLQNTVNCAAFLLCRATGNEHPVLMMLLSRSTERLAGMLVDANAYGGLLAVAFSIVLLGGNSKKPLLAGWLRTACLLSLSIGLLLTSSRSAWVGIAFITMYAGIRSPRLMLLIVLIAITGIGMIAFFLSAESFEQFITLSSRQNTIEERVEIIDDAWEMFSYNPAFGAGLGAYFEEHGIIVHNSAMWFLVEFGVIGLIVFIGFMSSFIMKGVAAFRTAPTDHQSLIAGLIAAHLAMLGISLGIEATYQRHWWMVMSLLGASYTLSLQDTKNENSSEQTEI